eukprot:jgi/Ulvmu1/7069/UM033_0130.1
MNSHCQRCDDPITFTDVHSVSDQHRRHAVASARDQGPPSHMLESYVDVTQPGAATAPAIKGGLSGLAQILDLATTHSQIDHPICGKCLESVKRELQDSIAAAEAQASAYEAALKSLLGPDALAEAAHDEDDQSVMRQQAVNMSNTQLQKQLEAAEREEQVERERADRLEAELAQAQQELAEVAVQEEAMRAEEDDYWRRYDALCLDLHGHMEEVDAVAAKVDVAARQLDSLRQTSVLEDCFHIWYRDRFGTISGFRLGRWKEEVKWPEVNAAWGQAVLLLDMMTRMYPDFKWEQGMLKPMASHSMVSDGKEDFKLFGPVNRMWCGRYDRALLLYLSCLEAFARYARNKDARLGRTPMSLPNVIDAEKGTVRSISIRYGTMVGGADNWNKALKCMLVDLKVMLHWVMQDQGMASEGGTVAIPPQMLATAAPAGARHQMANSTFVGRATAGVSADRVAQSMMQTGGRRDGGGW